MEKLHARILELEAENREITADNHELRADNRELRADSRKVNAENRQLRVDSVKDKDENSDLKAKLTKTQATLGEYVVLVQTQREQIQTPGTSQREYAPIMAAESPMAGPHRPSPPVQAQSRSPSVEIIEAPVKAGRDMGKMKEEVPTSISLPLSYDSNPTFAAEARSLTTQAFREDCMPVASRKLPTPNTGIVSSKRPSSTRPESDQASSIPKRQKGEKGTKEHQHLTAPLETTPIAASSVAIASSQRSMETNAVSVPSTSAVDAATLIQNQSLSLPQKPDTTDDTIRTASAEVPSPAASSGMNEVSPLSSSTVTTQGSPALEALDSRPSTRTTEVPRPGVAFAERYLSEVPTLTIEPKPFDLAVSRKFLRLAYSGSDQHFLQYFDPSVNPSGPCKRRLAFPTHGQNPALPSLPGEPGLILSARLEVVSNGPWTIFVKKKDSRAALWIYQGEYLGTVCERMSAEQFRSLDDGVKNEWAKSVLKSIQYDVYLSMRARVALRKAGRIPIVDGHEQDNRSEVEEARLGADEGDQLAKETENLCNAKFDKGKQVTTEEEIIRDEMAAVRRNRGKGLPVTAEDILEAFSNGDEGLEIIRLTCEKYDHVFANDMKAKWEDFNQATGSFRQNQKTPICTSKRAARHSKRSLTPDSDAMDVDHDVIESGNEYPAAILSSVSNIRRSTRRRTMSSNAFFESTDEGD